VKPAGDSSTAAGSLTIAWVAAATFYFYQYVLRSAPSVMAPQLGEAYGLTAGGVASLAGLFYLGYGPFSLVAGVAMDRLGPRKTLPLCAAAVGIGAFLFATGNPSLAAAGRFLQGAAGVSALVGGVYIATTGFPPARAATLIGATQMFGMAGGAAGQFVVGPAIAGGLKWNEFWGAMGIFGLALGGLLLTLIAPPPAPGRARASGGWLKQALAALGAVFRNPQSWLCGLVSGLMFTPTTIFGMVWGVRFLQEGHDTDYVSAVMRSASLPVGWIIGCPLLGALSDQIGRRKPVIVGGAAALLLCLVLILHGPNEIFPPFTLGLFAGIASGAAMLPYTVIKEANRPEHSGTATGVVNFLNFSLTALLSPWFAARLTQASGEGERELGHYQQAFTPLVWGVGLAIVLAMCLRETGKAAARPQWRTA
jgi:MFS family permease